MVYTQRNLPVGGTQNIEIELTPKLFGSINKRVINIPLPKDYDLTEMAGLTWSTVATFRCNDQQLHQIIGPAIRQKK